MSAPNILISGSGIAGSVFSYWMLRAYPKAIITIVERSPTLRLTGASVDIRSSAVEIMKSMGVEKDIRANSTNETGMQWVDGKDKSIAKLMASGREDVQSFTSEYEIFRGAMAEIFINLTKDKINLIFDDYVESYTQDSTGVAVTFAKSKNTAKYDLLVAADGFGSKTRGHMLGTNPREQIHDEGIHVAYFTIKEDLLQGSKLAKWYNTTRGRTILLRPDPKGWTRAHFMNIRPREDLGRKKRFDDAIEKGHEAYMNLLEEEFHDAGWIAPRVLKGMRECDDFYCSLFAQVRSPKLQDGRVVLLGDAGYATPGIGTSLAITGAYTLAGELLREPNNFELAAQRYEQVMKPIAKGVQGDDNAMQYMNPQTERGLMVRNMVLKTVTGLKIDRMGMKAAAWLGLGDKKTKMAEYPWPKEVESVVL